MHRSISRLFFVVLFAVALCRMARAQVDEVDPSIGGNGFLLQPTRPTVSLPNSMVRVYPMRRDALDDRISSFPLTIISHRQGELFWIMPGDGQPDGWHRPLAYDQEHLSPYRYHVRFDDSSIETDFAPTAHCGYFRFAFPNGPASVLLGNREGGSMAIDGDAVTGTERFDGMAAYVYGRFSAPVKFDTTAGPRRLTVSADGHALDFRYGVSFISVEQAKQNLEAEIPSFDFDRVVANGRAAWEGALGQIKVEGGTPAQRRAFYTALYRCFERMVCITENGRYYGGFDHTVHTDARPFYVDNWLWDTYRALEPLQTLLNPRTEADKIQSYVRMYEQLGWLPCFAITSGNLECMTGNHAAAWMADAWGKGVRDFDLKTAYAGVRKNSLEGTWLPWKKGPKCELDDFLNAHGYMPALHVGEHETVKQVTGEKRQAVSVTLAQSYDDWCTAQLARAGGATDPADYDLFLKRAGNYRNVFRADKGHVWPKDADGKWIEPFDPGFSGGQGGRNFTTENNGYTFDWDVQHDLAGLTEQMGGRDAAERKLDQLFRQSLGRGKYDFWYTFPDATGLVGQFSMGNEPSLHIPYIYDYLGSPWKTQKRVRMLMDTWFTDTLLGMPGDEDGGGMSAFVVFSMAGLYPVTPGVPAYNICSPVFDRVTFHLQGGKTFDIVCHGNSTDNKYIQSIRLNGVPLNQVWCRHADVANGGTMELQLGNVPNKTLGADPATFPPSAMMFDPRTIETPTAK